MNLIKQILTVIIFLSLISCQMRGNGGRKENGSEVPTTPGGSSTGPVNNYTTITDEESMRFACELYEAQQRRDEWFNTHGLLDSCGYVDTTVDAGGSNPTVTENLLECNDAQRASQSETTTCQNFGDPAEANRIDLHISIKFKLLNKVVILIQNGIITMQPLYDWYSRIKNKDEEAGAFLAAIGFPPSLLFSADKHFIGALPGMGPDCNESGDNGNTNGNNVQANQAEVSVNGTKYTWNWPGLTSFKIKEFFNQYTYSIDCATPNGSTDSDSKTIVQVKGSTFNNFNYPIHVVTAQNTDIHPRFNTGCRETTVNFDLHYDQAKDGEFTAFDMTNDQLETQCAAILSENQQ